MIVDEKQVKVESLYSEIMEVLGINPQGDSLDTPKRVAKSLIEMTENVSTPLNELDEICTTFENYNNSGLVMQDGIEFSSNCSHHHLPFFGKVKITYEPNELIIGLSKFQRIVDFFAKKPQVQEDLTHEIARYLINQLEPHYLKVEIYDCIHTCMSSRGVRSNAKTSTQVEIRRDI